jgi:hypothetical protein
MRAASVSLMNLPFALRFLFALGTARRAIKVPLRALALRFLLALGTARRAHPFYRDQERRLWPRVR